MTSMEKLIQDSACFGVAYDSTVVECKNCDAKLRCETCCREGKFDYQKPKSTVVADAKEIVSETPVKTPRKKPTVKEFTTVKHYSPDMPDFKGYTNEELLNMVIERNAGTAKDFEKYQVANILRMRLIMALKKSYEI